MKYVLPFSLLLATWPASLGWAWEAPFVDVGVALTSEPAANHAEPVSGVVAIDETATGHSCQEKTCACCRLKRAGNPHQIAPWARLTYGPKYTGYYVGGGRTPKCRLLPGDWRCRHEGTWGVDYNPRYSRVRLLWSHGRLYQGGTGQYEPDHCNWPFGQLFGPKKK